MAVAEKLTTTTDLARNYPSILDDAARGPVSIPREKGKAAITLVARDAWLHASCAEQWIAAYSAIVFSCLAIMADHEAPMPFEFSWLRSFTKEDLVEFLREFSESVKNAVAGVRSWDDVEATLHEWHRSALALGDAELQARFKQARSGFDS